MKSVRRILWALIPSLLAFNLIACSTQAVHPPESAVMPESYKIPRLSSRVVDHQYKIKNESGIWSTSPIWMPAAVYNDGTSVYICLPSGQNNADFKIYVYDRQQQLAPASYQKNKRFYRVDTLFKKALLVKDQEKVSITYIGNRNV